MKILSPAMGKVILNLSCYVLCAAGYAEESMQRAKMFLVRGRVEPAYLGLKSGLISGGAGGSVLPQVLISLLVGEEAAWPLPDGLLVAGGAACGQQLLADPRVHALIQQMIVVAKPVGFLHPVFYPLVELLRQKVVDDPFLLQEKPAGAEFFSIFGRRLYRSGTTAAP